MTPDKETTRLPHLAACIGEDYEDSFAACRALLAAMFDLEAPPADQRAHYGIDFALYDFGPIKLGMSSSMTAPWTMVRSPRVIARSGVDHFHVQYYRAGGYTMRADGPERQVEANDICMLDFARPVTLRADRIDNLSAIVERALLAPLLTDTDELHGMVLSRDSEAGVALREHLDEMWQQAPNLTVAQGLEMSHVTVGLIAALIRANGQSRAATGGEFRKSQFRAICRRIDTRLADPELAPDMLVSAFHMTRPTLYRMFEPHGGVARYVLGRRLAHVLRDLSDPSLAHEKIDVVCRRWGLTNPTVAGRAFRNAYGMTPSECRARTRNIRPNAHGTDTKPFDIPPELPPDVAAFKLLRLVSVA